MVLAAEHRRTLMAQVVDAAQYVSSAAREYVIVTSPGATGVTSPVLETVATDVLLLLHVTVPPPAEVEPVSCNVFPITRYSPEEGHPEMEAVRGVHAGAGYVKQTSSIPTP